MTPEFAFRSPYMISIELIGKIDKHSYICERQYLKKKNELMICNTRKNYHFQVYFNVFECSQ